MSELSPADNPYAAPRAAVVGTVSSAVLQERLGLLAREATLRGLGGGLAFVAAPLVALVVVLPGVLIALDGETGANVFTGLALAGVGVGGAVSTARLGRRLLRLERLSVLDMVVATGFSMLAFPGGPALMVVTAVLAFTGTGRRVLSEEGASLREQSAGVERPRGRALVVGLAVAGLLVLVQPVLSVLLLALAV